VGVIFSLFPGLTFAGLAAIAFIGNGAYAGASFFRVQRIGLAVFAALLGFIALLLLVIAVAGRTADTSVAARFREGIDYVYGFVLKVAVFMYLFIWYRATWPRYRFDQLMRIGWKVMLPIALGVLMLTASWGDRFMNPALNSAAATMNTGMAPVATPWFFYALAGAALISALFVITRRTRCIPRWR